MRPALPPCPLPPAPLQSPEVLLEAGASAIITDFHQLLRQGEQDCGGVRAEAAAPAAASGS